LFLPTQPERGEKARVETIYFYCFSSREIIVLKHNNLNPKIFTAKEFERLNTLFLYYFLNNFFKNYVRYVKKI